jgi:hypothetical protein
MDFTNRSAQPAAAASSSVQQPSSGGGRRNKSNKEKWGRIGVVLVVAAVVLLLLGLILTISTDNSRNENKYVKSDKLQAVFLNTGQVYFGKVKSINSKNVVLSNIYYLQTSSNGSASTSTTNSNISLVKLGCELHEPYDQMVINRDQVTFWENLQDDGQVAKAVAAFVKQNPQGQKCADQSSSASTNSSSAAQNAGSSNGASNSTTNTTTNRSTNP